MGAKASKMYDKDKAPRLDRDEKGNVAVKEGGSGEPSDKEKESDATQAGTEGMEVKERHMHERREMQHRHMHEHMGMHHKHEIEHSHHTGSKEMLHERHEQEKKQMHTRHEHEHKMMHDKHEKEMTSEGGAEGERKTKSEEPKAKKTAKATEAGEK